MRRLMSLFARARTSRRHSAPPRFARPGLERLETRDCPSGLAPLHPALLPIPWGPVQMAGPSVTLPTLTLAVAMNGMKSVTLHGIVTADNPANLTVTFSGAVTGTTTTNNLGDYSLTINANGLGQVQASTLDADGQVSNTATAIVASPAPVISEFGWEVQSGWFVFTGRVTCPDAGNMTVTLQGAPVSFQQGIQVQTKPDGTFTFLIKMQPNPNEQGMVYASCTDCWGQHSNDASTYVTQPTI